MIRVVIALKSEINQATFIILVQNNNIPINYFQITFLAKANDIDESNLRF